MNLVQAQASFREGSIKRKVLSALSEKDFKDRDRIVQDTGLSEERVRRTLIKLRAQGYASSKQSGGNILWRFHYDDSLVPWDPPSGTVDSDIKQMLDEHGPVTPAEAARILSHRKTITVKTRLAGLASSRRILSDSGTYFLPKAETVEKETTEKLSSLVHVPRKGTIRYDVLRVIAQNPGVTKRKIESKTRLGPAQVRNALSPLKSLGFVRSSKGGWYPTALVPPFAEEAQPGESHRTVESAPVESAPVESEPVESEPVESEPVGPDPQLSQEDMIREMRETRKAVQSLLKEVRDLRSGFRTVLVTLGRGA